jgi:hypothetical protein
MPLQVLELGKQFRPNTTVVYPPFKNGRYMEEYFYDYIMSHKDAIDTDYVYIPAFWTNIQIHPNFESMKINYNILLKRAYSLLPPETKYFTVVQHDLGVLLELPKNTKVFGACFGNIPLPLIYEDITNKLENIDNKDNKDTNKKYLASFVGTYTTHPLRVKMVRHLGKINDFKFSVKHDWTDKVSQNLADKFIETTLQSKFCLAPRGFGRSSFRFFEAIQLNTVPVYFWDDVEWLPYKDVLDYSKFAVSIHTNDIPNTSTILSAITEEQYKIMVVELKKVKHYFTLEGMSKYIINHLLTHH